MMHDGGPPDPLQLRCRGRNLGVRLVPRKALLERGCFVTLVKFYPPLLFVSPSRGFVDSISIYKTTR